MLRLGGMIAAALLALGLGVASAQTPDARNWRPVDPENTLYIDTVHGRIVVELYPEVAPRHVERIKTLTRAGYYDGLTFHRVIDDFMAQTGDPLGTGEGASTLPDLREEFMFRRGPDMPFIQAAEQSRARLGFASNGPGVHMLADAQRKNSGVGATTTGSLDGTVTIACRWMNSSSSLRCERATDTSVPGAG